MQNDIDDELATPRHIGLEEAVFIVLVILSLLGISITDFSPHDGYGYWIMMVFVFAGLSIFVSWLQSKANEDDIGIIVKAQAMHWLHTLIVVGAAFLLNKSGQLTDTGASLVILLILALTTMLDGYRIGWQFSLLGFFLASCAIVVAYVEHFILASSGLGLLVVAGTFFWNYWLRKNSGFDDA
ncbi:hypothetical protein [Methylomonas methanica]|uniref:Uncharacterized protein n=1 Tax=Methylomonas methanica (strain DSM 25384 / MC09) TaxID=857087 RepID=G0A0D3_METMM|nr:hypothetical protein [Methylomonas methanica]AEG02439.1 hypothetical protein Metme_4086 [Methylomonas methanica MC09]